jgi:tRNA-specific 2-thiouridylase
LQNYIKPKIGKIIDIVTKQCVGQHEGIAYFTLGQNKGLSLSGQKKRYYVCGKDVKHNVIYVCDQSQRKRFLTSTQCTITKFN